MTLPSSHHRQQTIAVAAVVAHAFGADAVVVSTAIEFVAVA